MCLWLAVTPLSAVAENLSALAGVTDGNDDTSSSYGWQIEFQEPLSQWLTSSLSWINEGHLPDHSRDGVAAQVWLVAPQWRRWMALSLGVGPYVYFDTQPTSSTRGFSDHHGAAALFTASVDINLPGPWFLRFNLNDIDAPGDISTVAVLVGGGYHFDTASHAGFAASAPTDPAVAYGRQQIQLLAGELIFSDLNSREARQLGVDYRLGLASWAAGSLTWFYDPDSAGGRRNRVASQLWLVDPVEDGKLSFSAGVGVYTQLGPLSDSATTTPGRVSGLTGLRAEWQWSSRSSLILCWYRTFTSDDNDRDIITLGYGWRFGST